MPRQQVQKTENQFAILSNNKYMKETVNPYPTLGNKTSNYKKNIGEWGTKSTDIYIAPQPSTSIQNDLITISPIKNTTVHLVKQASLVPRNTESKIDVEEQKENYDSDEE